MNNNEIIKLYFVVNNWKRQITQLDLLFKIIL